MNVGCYGLIAIALFIGGLAIWSRRKRQGVREFYTKHSLFLANDAPQNVREAMSVTDPMCLKGKLAPRSGGEVIFYWWEWSASSLISTGNGVQSSISCFLAISFLPDTISQRFKELAIEAKEAKQGLSKYLKDIYALNTKKPIRIEDLPDGSFVIFWQIVQRPEVMEDKIAWLTANLSVINPMKDADVA